MHFRRSLPAAAALAAALGAPGAPALGQEAGMAETLRLLQRLATQYAVLMTRMFVDLTYDSIAIEPGTNDLIVTGLRLRPELDWDQDRQCEIAVERAVIADTNSLDLLRTTVELGGLTLPPACLDPAFAATLAGFGYDGLTADSMAIDIAYHLPSSAADLVVQASILDAAAIALSAHFDYLFVAFPWPTATIPPRRRPSRSPSPASARPSSSRQSRPLAGARADDDGPARGSERPAPDRADGRGANFSPRAARARPRPRRQPLSTTSPPRSAASSPSATASSSPPRPRAAACC